MLNAQHELEKMMNQQDTMTTSSASSSASQQVNSVIEELLKSPKHDPISKEIGVIEGQHSLNILSVRFNREGDRFASSSTDKSVVVSHVAFEDPSTTSNTSSSSNNTTNNMVKIGKQLRWESLHGGGILSLDWNPLPKYGHLLLTGGMDRTVKLLDTRAPQAKDGEITTMDKEKSVLAAINDRHKKYVVRVRWSVDGQYFAIASYDHSVSLYRLQEEGDAVVGVTFVHQMFFPVNVEAIAFSPDALVVATRDNNYLTFFDPHTLQLKEKKNMNANMDDHVSFNAMDLNFSKDYSLLLVQTDKERLIMFHVEYWQQVRNLYGALNDDFSQPRCVWDVRGEYIYGTSQDKMIYVWQVSDQKVVQRLKGHTALPRTIHMHPTKQILCSGGFDKTIRFWGMNNQ